MSCERASTFDQLKTLSENYEPMVVGLWFLYKFTKSDRDLRPFSEFMQTEKSYPTSLDKSSILT